MITVIICTYNRSESLKRTLKSLEDMSVPPNLSWELIVVDNNSSDDTRKTVEDFSRSSGLNMRYLFERNQGLSHARNRGIAEAKGEIIAFTDDDVVVEKDWLQNIDRAFTEHDAACVGGKILPVWEKPCPRWLTQKLYGYLALLDYGDRSLPLIEPKLWGANFAVKKALFEKYGYFDTLLGRIPGKLYAGEETAFCKKLIKNGEKILYVPDMIVHHFISSTKTCKSYFRRWEFDRGELNAIILGYYPHRNILGIPLYMIKETIKAVFLWISQPFGSERFMRELRLAVCIGFIFGRLRLRWGRKYKSKSQR